MSIQIAKELHCDGCSEWFRLDYDTITEYWKYLRQEGWTREAGQHFCPKCGLHGSYENHEQITGI